MEDSVIAGSMPMTDEKNQEKSHVSMAATHQERVQTEELDLLKKRPPAVGKARARIARARQMTQRKASIVTTMCGAFRGSTHYTGTGQSRDFFARE